jgi:hypothetical protein
MRIESRGTQLVREKEIERGVNVESRGTQLAYKGDQWGN